MLQGIDIAHWNGNPFNKSTQAAYNESQFVITKLTQGTSYKYTEYGLWAIKKALADGKLAGAYHYATGENAVKEADYFISIVKPYIGKVILALDYEDTGNRAWRSFTWAKQFLDRVKEQTGVEAFLYTGTEGIAYCYNCAEYPLWYARYPENKASWTVPEWKYKVTPWTGYTIWQFTSSNNTIDRNTAKLTKTTWKQYATPNKVEKEKTMAVKVGSARIDERGKASGGVAGDQTGREVATENWYLHSQGWICIRAKTATMREKIAQDMEYACNNPNIGYDQGQNTTLWHTVKNLGYNCSKVTTPCETDCARLVRVCCWYAGSHPADFYTGSEVQALKATGDFDILTAVKYTTMSDYLLRGDILVTKTQGHTVVVLNNGAKVTNNTSNNTSSNTTVVNTDTTTKSYIKSGQKWLNQYYGTKLVKYYGAMLTVDGVFGPKTRNDCVCVWKDLANRKYGAHLDPGNSNFLSSSKKTATKVQVQLNTKGTMAFLAKFLLLGKGFGSGDPALDTVFNSQAVNACKQFQKKKGLKVDGIVGAETWYALFN